jgi:hypothetical protein
VEVAGCGWVMAPPAGWWTGGHPAGSAGGRGEEENSG